MNRLKLTIIFAVLSLTAFSQIKKIEVAKKEIVGKIAPGGAITLTMECYRYEDDTYLFRYLDTKFSKIEVWKDFKIKSTEDFNTLYSYLEEGFSKMPEEAMLLNIGDGYLILRFSKFLGGKVVKIAHSTSDSETAIVGYTNLYTVKQINKLFGKTK
ncbi:hypothetical protein [Pedobacter xixiisoli]|uniref:Uncharacterized protein n=1 Tax=Pedobacter xixiisoli TaxID=1476464 RepID=A0A285ZRV6_9SPHI|nr:hypothetical protein [Pedobacter xixiisoli]SOD12379.1 hypothetical protein SAMN06297358_0636 [Pedobacter xixiisoli]